MTTLCDRLFRFRIAVGPPVIVGETPLGMRRYIPLLSGTVEGKWTGTVLPGGADWQVIRADGTLEIDAHYVLDLEPGRVEIRSTGLRAASPAVLARMDAGEVVPRHEYYFRTAIRMATAAPEMAELNTMLAIAVGERLAREVIIDVYPVA